MTKLPVIFCIDVEPDARQVDPADNGSWAGFEATAEFFNDLRPCLEETTGAPAKFSWFLRMDPQVERVYGSASWVVHQYGNLIEQLERAGDEIGLHTHAWRWDDSTREWIADHGDQLWVEHCVRTSFRAYEESLDRPCRSFRFGDHWMNNETMHLLESLGVEFDLTIEPGIRDVKELNKGEGATGPRANYVSVPTNPFRPSKVDFRRPGNRSALNLWSIPLSTGRRLITKPGPLAPIKRAVSTFKWRHQPLPLNPAIAQHEFNSILNCLLSSEAISYIAPVVRTDAAIKNGPKLKQNMETMLTHRHVSRFRFVKPNEALQLLNVKQSGTAGLKLQAAVSNNQ